MTLLVQRHGHEKMTPDDILKRTWHDFMPFYLFLEMDMEF